MPRMLLNTLLTLFLELFTLLSLADGPLRY